MRVLFLSAAVSIHTIKWVNALADRGNKVLLVSQPDQIDVNHSVSKKVKIQYLPYGGIKGYYLNALALRKITKKFKPDIINAHYASGYGTLARWARLPKVLLSVWGSDVYEFPYQSKLKMHIAKANINYAAKIASTSHCMARQTNKLMGRDLHCAVTPFGVDINLFKKIEVLKDDSKVVFGIVKTLSPKYGIDDLIHAYEIFIKNNSTAKNNTELQIYGGGEQDAELRSLAAQTKLNIKFMGKIKNTEVPKALNAMDIFCCSSSSSSESFGVAAVEAMACNLPVISTDVDGFMEVTVDGVTGYTVPRKNPNAMAEKMQLLYESPELREKFGSAGRKRVLELYQWDKNVDIMLDVYRTMIKE